MSKNRASAHSISGVFVFLLLGIFALFATVMVVLGVRAYRETVDRSGMHGNERIAAACIRGKLRGFDETDAIRFETVDGVDTIAIGHTYTYVTRYYVYNGRLYRLMSDVREAFDPEDGEPLCYVHMPDPDGAPIFTATREGTALTVTILVDGDYSLLSAKTEEGVDCAAVEIYGTGEDDRLYVWDGALMRQNVTEEGFDPSAGDVLCAADSMRVSLSGSVMTIEAEADPAVVRAEAFDGVETVAVYHPADQSETRATRLFVWNGMLCESTQESGEPFEPDWGEPICEALALEMTREGELATVRIRMPDESWLEFHVALRAVSAEGGTAP